MCGISGIFGRHWRQEDLSLMVASQGHRGPDAEGTYYDPAGIAGLGHNRLSIIDLSEGGRQPMISEDGDLVVMQNGEIYNYIELRKELERDHVFKTQSDTEVILAAYRKWGKAGLDRFIGMFAIVIWDVRERSAFIARDRFGVKPVYFHQKPDGTLLIASEIKALHAAGVIKKANDKIWATYLTHGLYDHSNETFWSDVYALPAGHYLSWEDGRAVIAKWYDLAEKVGGHYDQRSEAEVQDEYFALMKESVLFRFRSDVAVGINLSGGLDSSSLLGLVHQVQGEDSDVKAFTFITGDADYDELPWVEQMLAATHHPLTACRLDAQEVPHLAENVQFHQDEPFGGLPTLAYAKLFERAKEQGITVLLDGNGMDEQWAGYDYYHAAENGHKAGLIQGTAGSPVRPECLDPELRSLAEPLAQPEPFEDRLRNLQYRDAVMTKIPRAMRFNDRVSMRSSTELREPFLDHRLFELAMRQRPERKISGDTRKKMLRDLAGRYLPRAISETPKRPMQTPQREWLRGPLRDWVLDEVEAALTGPFAAYFDRASVEDSLSAYFDGGCDNSFFVWQWMSAGMMGRQLTGVTVEQLKFSTVRN